MTRYKSYRCGGFSSSSGPCGAPDCATCYPELNRGGYYEEHEPGTCEFCGQLDCEGECDDLH